MIKNGWSEWLQEQFRQDYFIELAKFIKQEYATKQIYPPKQQVFSAFETVDYKDVKVVILGQDPYHQKGQAHGMCFSVNYGVKIPPSLVNIYKELNRDLYCKIPNHGYLMKWAKQGVFLLNTVLTVQDSHPLSHTNHGWEIFTDHVITRINAKNDKVVFLLWGKNACSKIKLIDRNKHSILTSVHPSPLSAHRGFFGCGHFSKANQILMESGKSVIDWQIENI